MVTRGRCIRLCVLLLLNYRRILREPEESNPAVTVLETVPTPCLWNAFVGYRLTYEVDQTSWIARDESNIHLSNSTIFLNPYLDSNQDRNVRSV